MRGNLIERPSLSLGQARALLVRHMVYSCILIACVAMGARIMRGWYQPRRADSAAHLQGVTKTLALCRSELERFERHRDWLTQAKEARARPRRILMSLGGALPEDVWINVVSAEDNDLTVVGSSTTETALSTFLERLVSKGLLERVRLDASREIAGKNQGAREFSISGSIAVPGRNEEVLSESHQ